MRVQLITVLTLAVLISGTRAAAAEPAAPAPTPPPVAAPGSAVSELRSQAAAITPLLTTDAAGHFVRAAASLPAITARTLHVNKQTRSWFTPAERAMLAPEVQAGLTEVVRDESFYYNTRYGTPLAYARAFELLAAQPGLGKTFQNWHGKRILDYGYGTIGHLRLLATCGAHVVGIDTDASLVKLYSDPGDTGTIKGWTPSEASHPTPDGSIRLITGRFPVDPGCTPQESTGPDGGFDLFISKNTLKNGYIHPAEPVDKRMLVDLGTSEAEYLKALFAVLKPGGVAMIYNICPAPAKPGEKYIPWADGRSPFSREQWEAAGFEVVAIDESDNTAMRAMARALGWDKDGMKLDDDLFVWWTLVRRRG